MRPPAPPRDRARRGALPTGDLDVHDVRELDKRGRHRGLVRVLLELQAHVGELRLALGDDLLLRGRDLRSRRGHLELQRTVLEFGLGRVRGG